MSRSFLKLGIALSIFGTCATEVAHAQSASRIVVSAQSGDWSAPATWKDGHVPTTGNRVIIRRNHTVRYDVVSARIIRLIHIAGTLTFAHDRDTRLEVGLIRIQTGDNPSENGFDCDLHPPDADASGSLPALEVGAPNRPIDAGVTATIRLHFLPGMDAKSCPAIVCCAGRMDFHGAPMNRTWIPLDATAEQGNTIVRLKEAPTGWKIGDRVILTATRGNFESGRTRRPGKADSHPETEERVVKKIDGVTLTLHRPLRFTHAVADGFRGVVANLSRNVVVESADPNGVRGHTMYHRHSAGAIAYAEFRHLGKENTLGRYAIHYHRVANTMRGSYVLGASIWDSHNRWITVHGTNYLVIRDCVGYQSVGHGFYLEDGSEILNVFDRNLAVQAFAGSKLPNQALPFDENEGAGFWWANSYNTFINNLSCENDRYGYRFEATDTAAMRMLMPITFPDGTRVPCDLRTLPFVRFENNQSHADGRYGFNLGEGVAGVGPSPRRPFIIRHMRIWETHYAFRPQSPGVLVENMTIKNCEYGIYHPNYDHHVYRNLHLIDQNDEPFNRGHDDDSVQYGSVTVDGLTFENVGTEGLALIQLSDSNPSGSAATHIRNLKIVNTRGRSKRAIVDLGGSAKPEPKTRLGVPVYLHDYFGPGRTAKIVSIKSGHLRDDGLKYGQLPPLTGAEAGVAEVRKVPFPRLLDPIDDLPPATVITQLIPAGKDRLIVRGVCSDNGTIAKVIVNGLTAKSLRGNFTQWETTLTGVHAAVTIHAHAVDEAGNVERTPHVVRWK